MTTLSFVKELTPSNLTKMSHFVITLNELKIFFAVADNIPIYDPDHGLEPKDIVLINPAVLSDKPYNPSEVRRAICDYILQNGFPL